MDPTTGQPTVTIGIPVLNEAAHLEATMRSIRAQSYPRITQILVADGGSSDGTLELVKAWADVELVHNERRIQAAGLNEMLARATGEVFVRVDGHCQLAPDYVERCCGALQQTRAAIVGGAMTPEPIPGRVAGAIARAMCSRLGAGPARFHVGGEPGWVDTVYLGAYRTSAVVGAGGYAIDVGVNEDAELAIRMREQGGVWFDPSIRSKYVPRSSLGSVRRQFFRYGRSRAATLRRHPRAARLRQLAPPSLIVGLLSPWRRPILIAYLALVAVDTLLQRGDLDSRDRFAYAMVLPVMHGSWGLGFGFGLFSRPSCPKPQPIA